MTDQNLRYACLFGGGAIRGAAHVGVIRALEEFGVEPLLYGGSSVGSIIAVLWAIGYSVDEMFEIFSSVNFELFRDVSFGFNKKFALSKGEVFLDWFRELIESKYYGADYVKGENPPVKFKDVDKDIVIITTNMKDFSCNEFSSFVTPDFEIATAVRISCCMPGLMRAYTFDDKLLVDGDLMKGKPMWALTDSLKNFQDRILEIRLEGNFTGSDENPIEYVNGMYTCLTSCETEFVNSIYKDYDKYDYLVINTGNLIVVDFNCSKEERTRIVERGYNQTKEYFLKDFVEKKKRLLKLYTQLKEKLVQADKAFTRGKYAQGRNLIAEVFIPLSKYGHVADERITTQIELLQELIFENVKFGLLGMVHCSRIDEILRQVRTVISEISTKIKEAEEQIKKFSV